MILVDISPDFAAQVPASLLEGAAQATLQHQKADPTVDLSIVLSEDEQLQQLNRQFRGIDAPTDVLSFPANYLDPDSGHLYLGDVLISYPRAVAQAQAIGQPIEAEVQLLVVHGILHLLGHDHAEAEDKAKMWAAQNQILNELKVSLVT